ncbi:MAG: alpha-glucosidase [Bacillota bacterium]|nr:alpha-glucosidase [Bacillota bacterium]
MKRTHWYKEAIVYQVYPYSFKDNNNDGFGDIAGILSKLDYIQELGITAIWFSPLYKTNYYDYGYDISDYRANNPDMGTMEEFEKLVEECHKRNLKVIMDMVINHTSIEHPWFQDAIQNKNSKYRDYYIIRKGKRKKNKLLPPTNWNSTFTGSAWKQIENSDEFYLHLFCEEQADLNWEHEEVRKEMADILNFWLEKGIDGFRFDVFNMYSKVQPIQDDPKNKGGNSLFVDGPRIHEYLHELYQRSLSHYDSFSVGESYQPSFENALKYADERNEELDAIFNFAHLDSDNISKFFPKPFNLKQFKDGLFQPQIHNYAHGWNTLVLENHDTQRSVSRFGIDTKAYRYQASTFLALITFLGFGTIFIYQGQEIGMTGHSFSSIEEMKDPVSHFVYNLMTKYGLPKKLALFLVRKGARDNARMPMQWDETINAGFNQGHTPWQCINPNYKEINVEKDLESKQSIYKFYQQLIKLKKENEVLIYGQTKEYEHNHKQMIVYTREYKMEKMVVLGNFSKKEISYSIPEEFKDKLELVFSNYTDTIVQNRMTFRPYEACVCVMKKEY